MVGKTEPFFVIDLTVLEISRCFIVLYGNNFDFIYQKKKMGYIRTNSGMKIAAIYPFERFIVRIPTILLLPDLNQQLNQLSALI